MSAPATDRRRLLVPLLEEIYRTGKLDGPDGRPRTAEPVGVPRPHALRLARLVRENNLRETLETGMAYGLSTLAIAGVHAARGAGHHIAIDPTENRFYQGIGLANVRRAGLEDRVRFIEAGSQSALPRLVHEGVRLDLGFIDGMHLFDYALIDFFYIDQMRSPGGFVAFHDVWLPGVRDAVDFVLANRAYDETGPSDAGLAVLRKRGHDRRRWDHHIPFAPPREPERTPEQKARKLLEEMRSAGEEALARAGGAGEHHFAIGGSSVRMRFAGPALEPAVLPAFSHARAPSGDPPDLDVLLWDSGSTGVPAPERPWGLGDVRARGDVLGYDGAGLHLFSDPASGSVTALDRERGEIHYWVMEPSMVPWYETGAPLRGALHHWTAGPDRHFMHAGAVGSDGAGVLLAGPSGSGKSTVALACLEAGLDYSGDDYVIVTLDERPRAHCLYSTAKLDPPALERLPGLASAVSDLHRGEQEKLVLELHGHRPGQPRPWIAVDAIVIPSIGPGPEPRLAPASGAAALRALAPTTLLQLPAADQQGMRAIARLVRQVPAFTLELGPDIGPVPDLVRHVCVQAAGTRRAGDRG
jgi:predicted O-methyltransferase YrrM